MPERRVPSVEAPAHSTHRAAGWLVFYFYFFGNQATRLGLTAAGDDR